MAVDELIIAFVEESFENLNSVDQDLVAVEDDPSNVNVLNRIFRVIHSIKGTAGFFELEKIIELTHAGEGLLDKMRNGEITPTPDHVNTMLEMVDILRRHLLNLERTGKELGEDFGETISRLKTLQTETAPPPSQTIKAKEVDKAARKAAEQKPQQITESSLRVDIRKLDKLMNMVSELVLARNQILQLTQKSDDAYFNLTAQRLNVVTSELQEVVMKTRMQPIERIWGKFPRIVRDLAQMCGKKVELVLKGQDTELDKSLIEAISDPLTHMIRNSIDHGIESPEDRVAKGKPEEGKLQLNAFHEGGQIVIEIIDDGKGIDPHFIKKKSVSKGIISEEAAAALSDHDAISLIFSPGFSTADEVSEISGRGVGMDVVKSYIEKVGGTVDLSSTPGKGARILVKLPLTLAIIPALIVICSGSQFVIPQANLQELIRFDEEAQGRSVEYIRGRPFYRLRGKILPLVVLSEVLEYEVGSVDLQERLKNATMIVLKTGNRTFGLICDEVRDTQEVVVKPLHSIVQEIRLYSGATIMGDGSIGLILDMNGLARAGQVMESFHEDILAGGDTQKTSESTETLILFSVDGESHMAVPMSHIDRLEIVAAHDIEFIGNHIVMQYRNTIMPLVPVERVLGEPANVITDDNQAMTHGDEEVHVAVFESGKQKFGLVVGHIEDILEVDMATKSDGTRKGVAYNVVIEGRVSEVLDIEAIVQMTYGPNSVESSGMEGAHV